MLRMVCAKGGVALHRLGDRKHIVVCADLARQGPRMQKQRRKLILLRLGGYPFSSQEEPGKRGVV